MINALSLVVITLYLHITKTEEIETLINNLQSEGASSLIFLAIGGELAGIISIYDPLKPEAKETIMDLRRSPNCKQKLEIRR